ncbi:MAG: type IX secretion system membrane protein PorP/SprF [Flavobacteriales bacterium]
MRFSFLKGAVIVLLCLIMSAAGAQDQQFTQFYAAPTAVNPAFAGASVQSRACVQYRNQWTSIPGAFNAGNITFDQFFPGINSGIGGMVNYEQAGSGALRSTTLALQYAYEARIKRNLFFRPALQFGVGQRAIDFTKLTFYDQMIREGNVPSLESGTVRPANFYDLGAGALLYSPKVWVGLSGFHVTLPDVSVYDTQENSLPIKYSVHGGYRHRMKGNSLRKLDRYVVIAANFLSQQKFDQLDLGFYYEYAPMVLGIWYRGLPMKSNSYGSMNRDALAFLLGFQAGSYRFGYSYDLTTSSLGIASSAGSHEITMVYQWVNKYNKKAKKIRVLPCAKF